MRAALVWFMLIVTMGTASADNLASGIRAELAAQGYEGIEVDRRDGQLLVHARRGTLILETVYDATSGKVISERVHRTNGGTAAKK